MLFYLVAFIVLLGPLVFVHELGHFVFAKLFNVRVDVFSMGFGPKLVRRKWGETEYALSAVPLGGYVKLYGQDPTESIEPAYRNRALNHLNAWKRFLVFLGGPLFNFLFAIFVFSVMLIVGESHVAPIVARVTPGSQAYEVGFRPGDLVTAINRQVVTKYDDISRAIIESPNKELVFRVRRGSLGDKLSERLKTAGDVASRNIKEIKVTPEVTKGMSVYGEPIDVGQIDGLWSFGRYTVVGVSNPGSLAGKAGLKTGDEIVLFNDVPIKSWEQLQIAVQQALSKGVKDFKFGVVPHEMTYWSPESRLNPATQASTEIVLSAHPLDQLGIHSSELFVSALVSRSPAQVAGVMPGDRLVSLDDKPLSSFDELREFVKTAGETNGAFTLSVERGGKILKREVTPTMSSTRDALGNEVKQFMMGVYPLFVQSEPQTFIERVFNPFTLTMESWSRALDLSAKTFISIKKLFTRQVSVSTLGGPILIGKLAGDSMSRGASSFLKMMALISISLAIFNILPVPILDGGHIFLLFIEVIRGKPITIRQTEVVQQVGLSLIVLLLVVVLFNDISRVGIPALRQLFQ